MFCSIYQVLASRGPVQLCAHTHHIAMHLTCRQAYRMTVGERILELYMCVITCCPYNKRIFNVYSNYKDHRIIALIIISQQAIL